MHAHGFLIGSLAVVASLTIAAPTRPSFAAPATQPAADRPNEDDWVYLDDGHIRVGVKKSSGGAIAWVSAGRSGRNLVNHFDRGRLVQQSYYGDADGSRWDKQPWRWNPVQGGDWKGAPAKLLELKTEPPGKLYARTLPKHWATGADVPDVTMEQWVTLEGKAAHVRYRMTYAGKVEHAARHQEIPAFFVEPDLDTLVLYDGDRPWTGGDLHRSKPGWPNESRKIRENWAAYVDKDDFGVGAYVPIANEITCYRFGKGGRDSCSYFAPLTTFAVKPGTVFEYDLYIAVGTTPEIRNVFAGVRKGRTEGQTNPEQKHRDGLNTPGRGEAR